MDLSVFVSPAAFVFYAAIVDVIAAALMGTHPVIAKVLAYLANLFRSRASKLPPLVLALAALALLSAPAQAGPIRDRLRARFGGCAPSAGSCSAPPARPAGYTYQTAPTGPYGVPVYRRPVTVVGSSCPGGTCPAPQRPALPVR